MDLRHMRQVSSHAPDALGTSYPEGVYFPLPAYSLQRLPFAFASVERGERAPHGIACPCQPSLDEPGVALRP